jgi:hypothetical protein
MFDHARHRPKRRPLASSMPLVSLSPCHSFPSTTYKSTPPSSRPIVLEPCSIYHLVQFCMHHQSPTKRLVICSSRDTFLQSLMQEIHQISEHASQPLDLLLPTLSNLDNARNVQITFCPDLANFRACLAALMYPGPELTDESKLGHASNQPPSLLIIVNPIQIHEHTLSFSAQGFNRTFASVVDTAHCLGRQLIMVESIRPRDEYEQEDEDMLDNDHPTNNPWDQNVSILNITTKTFGAGERGWVGRTVTIRQVAQRGCKFRELEHV